MSAFSPSGEEYACEAGSGRGGLSSGRRHKAEARGCGFGQSLNVSFQGPASSLSSPPCPSSFFGLLGAYYILRAWSYGWLSKEGVGGVESEPAKGRTVRTGWEKLAGPEQAGPCGSWGWGSGYSEPDERPVGGCKQKSDLI